MSSSVLRFARATAAVTVALVASSSMGAAQPTDAPSALPGEPWIVYQGGSGGPSRIRLVRPDGTGDHALIDAATPPALEQLHPDWSHDGSRIAFSAQDADGTRDIWVASVDGSDVTRVVDCAAPCAWTDDPAWSADDSMIMYAKVAATDGGPNGIPTLEMTSADGAMTTTLFTGLPIEAFYVPRWTPDGGMVMEIDTFASARVDETEALGARVGPVVPTANGRALAPLVDEGAWASYPAVNPIDGRVVLQMPVTDDPFGPADLFLIDPDEGEPTRLTTFGDGGGWAIQPSWTPDGSRIVFVAEDVVRTHPNVATIAADGTGLKRLHDAPFRTHPRLRPVP